MGCKEAQKCLKGEGSVCELENNHYATPQRNKLVMGAVGLKISAASSHRAAASWCLRSAPGTLSGYISDGNKVLFAKYLLVKY